jgi:lysophospholipase L1-like esterase
MSINKLLVPKWKKRTHETHMKHLSLYTNMHCDQVFLGDSMMERWLTTGEIFWKKSFRNSANLGVGGDKIENLLYRLTTNSDFKGILDVITFDKIFLMIGTNNIDKNSNDDIFEGIVTVINLIFVKHPNCKIIVYGITDRSDVNPAKIADCNKKIKNYIENENNPQLIYRFFGDEVNYDDKFFVDFGHLSYLGYKKWFEDIKKLKYQLDHFD